MMTSVKAAQIAYLLGSGMPKHMRQRLEDDDMVVGLTENNVSRALAILEAAKVAKRSGQSIFQIPGYPPISVSKAKQRAMDELTDVTSTMESAIYRLFPEGTSHTPPAPR